MDAEKIYDALLTLSEQEREKLFQRIRENEALWDQLHHPPSPLDYPKDRHYLLIFDGGSRGNPGKGYGSYAVIRCDTGQQRVEHFDLGDDLTNNEAEYRALIRALEDLIQRIEAHGKEPRNYRLEIRGDSRLVINQVNRRWKASDPRMESLRDEALDLLRPFDSYRLLHHDRKHSVAVLGH